MLKVDELIFTGRGCAALFLILDSLPLENKVLLLPVNICEIVFPVVSKAGYEIVFYDVDMNGNANLDTIKAAYSGRESVLLAVHNFGIPINIDEIVDWSHSESIFVIEDVCNALGASYKNRALGTWGDASIFSFGYAKILENGIGGALFVSDKTLKENILLKTKNLPLQTDEMVNKDKYYQSLLRKLRENGEINSTGKYNEVYFEYVNYLIYSICESEINKIKLQWKELDYNLLLRKEIADIYRNKINHKCIKHLDEVPGQIYWRYNLLVEPHKRDALIDYLRRNNVLVSAWYPPINTFFSNKNSHATFANAEWFASRVINLFVDHRVSPDMAIRTAHLINGFKK